MEKDIFILIKGAVENDGSTSFPLEKAKCIPFSVQNMDTITDQQMGALVKAAIHRLDEKLKTLNHGIS